MKNSKKYIIIVVSVTASLYHLLVGKCLLYHDHHKNKAKESVER